jgi:hypothetical protein
MMAVINPEGRIAAIQTSVADAKAKRDLLAEKIGQLLVDYERETGARIDSVYVNRYEVWGGQESRYGVEVSVSL